MPFGRFSFCTERVANLFRVQSDVEYHAAMDFGEYNGLVGE